MGKPNRFPYPLWQYPVIFWFLFIHLINIRFKITALIAWRREIGVISREHRVTFSDIMSFGHWLTRETINDWWYAKR